MYNLRILWKRFTTWYPLFHHGLYVFVRPKKLFALEYFFTFSSCMHIHTSMHTCMHTHQTNHVSIHIADKWHDMRTNQQTTRPNIASSTTATTTTKKFRYVEKFEESWLWKAIKCLFLCFVESTLSIQRWRIATKHLFVFYLVWCMLMHAYMHRHAYWEKRSSLINN